MVMSRRNPPMEEVGRCRWTSAHTRLNDVLTPCMLTRHCRRPATLAFHALHSVTRIKYLTKSILIDSLFVCFNSSVPYHKHYRPVTQQQQQQPNHPGTAKSTTENGRIILPKLNLNNNINQKNNTPSNKSSN